MNWRVKYFIQYKCSVLFKLYLYLTGLCSMRKRRDRRDVIERYKDRQTDNEVSDVLRYIARYRTLSMYNYDFSKRYLCKADTKIEYDHEKHMYYAMHCCADNVERKLYFADTVKNPYDARNIYNCWIREYDEQSPHKYISDFCRIPAGGYVADVGAQEGMFGLNYIFNIKKLYIFECDESWIRALNATFEAYADKVVIVAKYVGDEDNDDFLKLDTYFADKKIDLIKMDIEGWELKALHGGSRLLERRGITWAVCCYHNSDDEQKIADIFRRSGIEYAISSGLVYVNKDLRHALIWGQPKQ